MRPTPLRCFLIRSRSIQLPIRPVKWLSAWSTPCSALKSRNWRAHWWTRWGSGSRGASRCPSLTWRTWCWNRRRYSSPSFDGEYMDVSSLFPCRSQRLTFRIRFTGYSRYSVRQFWTLPAQIFPRVEDPSNSSKHPMFCKNFCLNLWLSRYFKATICWMSQQICMHRPLGVIWCATPLWVHDFVECLARDTEVEDSFGSRNWTAWSSSSPACNRKGWGM